MHPDEIYNCFFGEIYMSNQEVADSNARKDSQLPEFISAGTPVETVEEDNKNKWLANNLQLSLIHI